MGIAYVQQTEQTDAAGDSEWIEQWLPAFVVVFAGGGE